MKLHLQSDSGVTLIENIFIDQYMPAANGEFVKLYLYLLRCAGSGRDLSISSIADFFDHTEKDVRRALAYWEKLSLLQLRYDESNNITDILFTDPSSEGTCVSLSAGNSVSCLSIPGGNSPDPDSSGPLPEEMPQLPKGKTISAARRKALQEQEDIRQLIFVQEQYLKRPVTSTEVTNLLYFYDKLHFSTELIDYLIEYCASKGNPGVRYMEKVGQEWYLAGVTTVEEAKLASASYHKDYKAIFRSLGLGSRAPAPAETRYMDRWLEEYSLPLALILEACDRTIRQTHQASFDYTDSILKNWAASNVHSMEDVRKLDLAYQKTQVSKNAETETVPGRRQQGAVRKRSGSFSNMNQREYDWSSLEKQLLQAQSAVGKGSTL